MAQTKRKTEEGKTNMNINLQLFGGRGASAGGGDLGSSAGENINYTEKGDLMSLSETNFRNNIMDTIKDFQDDNPDLFNDGIVVKEIVADTKSTALAFWGEDGTLALNSKYDDAKAMDTAYAQCEKEGFHPSRGNKTAEQAVMAHELGHSLTSLAVKKQNMSFDEISKKIIREATAEAKTKNAKKFALNISEYAKKSNAECIAEAVADVYCNGSKAKAESHIVVNTLRKYI